MNCNSAICVKFPVRHAPEQPPRSNETVELVWSGTRVWRLAGAHNRMVHYFVQAQRFSVQISRRGRSIRMARRDPMQGLRRERLTEDEFLKSDLSRHLATHGGVIVTRIRKQH